MLADGLSVQSPDIQHFQTEEEFRKKYEVEGRKIVLLPRGDDLPPSRNVYQVDEIKGNRPLFILLTAIYACTLTIADSFSVFKNMREESRPRKVSLATVTVAVRVTIHMPTTGQPAHLGHMFAASETARTLEKDGFHVEKVCMCLSTQYYASGKKMKKGQPENVVSLQGRQAMLNAAIVDAKAAGMFREGIEVLQLPETEGHSGHVGKYRELTEKENREATSGLAGRIVVLAAGADLAVRMKNWNVQKIPFAAIVARSDQGDDLVPEPLPSLKRWTVLSKPEFASISSSKIMDGDLTGLGPEGLEKWKTHNPVSQHPVSQHPDRPV